MLSITARRNEEWIAGLDAAHLSEWVTEREVLLWIDVEQPSEAELALLQEHFHFHPLAMEDVRHSHQRPKLDFYDGYAFIVFYTISCDELTNALHLHEIEMFIGPHYIITLHDDPVAELSETHGRWERNVAHIGQDVGTLLYSLLDAILDGYFPALDWVAERLDMLEESIFEEFSTATLREVLALKQDLLMLRRVAGPHRDVANVLLRGEQNILPPAASPYLQDLYDHSLRIVESVDIYREMATTVTDGFLSVQSNNINEVMQRLTIINLLFLPLTVLTGFFGMNFEMLPFSSPSLLLFAVLAMVALPASLFVWLRRQGWG